MSLSSQIKQHALEVFENEGNCILQLKNYLDDDFSNVVELIFNSKGRVVIAGIGKSAIVAQKIVATLNSTGTPAIFLHAADAIHGDLGNIQENDVVFCISKSGNTPEIKVLVPLIKDFNNKLIAITGNLDSFLAKQADFTLNTYVPEEACPNNLAPTSSTVAQMAMGDAIAVCLLKQRGFSSSDFAKFHPGGALGKRLYLRIADVFVNNERPIVGPNQSLKEVILEISSKRLGITAVIENDKILGVVTDGDLRRMLEKGMNIETVAAKEIMTSNPITIHPETMAIEALNIMEDKNITQLVVAENGKYEGIVHLHDLLKEGIV